MMRSPFLTAYESGRFGLSFEFYPPKTPSGEELLWRHVSQLAEFEPAFVTCTYGAGGSTRDKTLDIVERVRRDYGFPVAAHLTCVGSTADQLRTYLAEARNRGIEGIVALRGDPPKGEPSFRAVPGGFHYANELVGLIRAEFPGFGIAVAGYPEKHQEAPSPEVDLQNLQRKVAAGADAVITQLFFSNGDYFDFCERCREIGITVPLIPGILPVTNLSQIQRITSLCGARLPEAFTSRLGERDDPQWQFDVGVDHASRQVQELVDAGVPGLHFYVLNKSQATAAVLRNAVLRGA